MRRAVNKGVFERKTPLMNVSSVLLALYCCVVVYLLFFMFMNSFKTRQDLIFNTLGVPTQFVLDNYKIVLFEDAFLRTLLNSLIVTTLSVVGILLVSSLAAYGLSRYAFKFRGALRTYFMLGMMFPAQLGILPVFIILRNLGLVNNFLGLALLYASGISLPVFIFTMFFKTLPSALYDSARIDGAGDFTVYWRIMMPLSTPIIITLALLNTISVWNDFFLPLVFLQSERLRTVTLGVYRYTTAFLQKWNLIFPAACIAMLPMVLLFCVFSDKIISGIAAGAIKE